MDGPAVRQVPVGIQILKMGLIGKMRTDQAKYEGIGKAEVHQNKACQYLPGGIFGVLYI
jgi:hypothetical protein